jgi:7-carboxy-7-deazaguanine synthase
MTYSVKEIFYTLQGEGANTGRPAVFCRFSGCNLWSGREIHRARAICQFCDTDFVGTNGVNGGKYVRAGDLASVIERTWSPRNRMNRFVVFTGGEPLLQLDETLIQEVKSRGFEVAVETNGTIPAPIEIDWLCVSPKANAELVVTAGDELKLVYPQEGMDPLQYEDFEFKQYYLQPLDDQNGATKNLNAAVEYCLQNPRWRLSLQTHKILSIP